MKQKIVYVVDSIFEPGSTHLLRALIRSNHANDIQSIIISLSQNQSEEPEQRATFDGADFQELPKTRFLFEQIYLLREFISAANPKIVHCWGVDSAFVTQIACLNLPIENIVSAFEKRNIGQRLLCRWAIRANQTKVVANHESTQNYLTDHQIIKCHRIIPSLASVPSSLAIDRKQCRAELLSLMNLQSRPEIFIAGTVVRFEPKYRLKDLVWAIDLICRVRQDVHLVIFGQGDNQPIRNYISKLQCDNNVHFISPSNSQMSLIAGIDMYWNGQREFAVAPAMVFAMQQMIPVISVLSDETRDLIWPLQTGLATNFGSRDEFARWTKYLIEIPEAAPTLGMQGKQHVENMLLKETLVDGYQRLYADLT